MAHQSEFEHLDRFEKQKVENDILKMKLMLERGAEFDEPLAEDPFIEKKILESVEQLENLWASPSFTTIFQKINSPTHLVAAADIPGEEIKQRWKDLQTYMEKFGVSLHVCSPNIDERELYRFAVEELFKLEIADVSMPGMRCVFIYDEFYPDPFFENPRLAVDECIHFILRKEPMQWVYQFQSVDLVLNQHHSLLLDQLVEKIDRYKQAYDDIEVKELKADTCEVVDDESIVTGEYDLLLMVGLEKIPHHGNWRVELKQEKGSGNWLIAGVQIDGIAF